MQKPTSNNIVACCELQQTITAWRGVFFITAGVYAFGAIFYGIFGSGQLQPWAIPVHSLQGIEVTVDDSPVYGE